MEIAIHNLLKSEASIETSWIQMYSEIGGEMQPIYVAQASRNPRPELRGSWVLIDFTDRFNATDAFASRQVQSFYSSICSMKWLESEGQLSFNTIFQVGIEHKWSLNQTNESDNLL